jgi:serine/threonine protein phosphatase PrpC
VTELLHQWVLLLNQVNFLIKILEIFEYKLQDNDKFFIIASDGVWEFIESDEVNIKINFSV